MKSPRLLADNVPNIGKILAKRDGDDVKFLLEGCCKCNDNKAPKELALYLMRGCHLQRMRKGQEDCWYSDTTSILG